MKLPAALFTAAVLLAAGACGSGDVTVPTDQGDVRVSKDGADIEIDSEDGAVTGRTGKLPDSFPANDVPLVEGQIVAAIAVDQTGGVGWSASIMADGAADEVHAQAVGLLKTAGFSEEGVVSAGVTSSELTNGAYRVIVASMDQGGQTYVQYAIEEES